MAKHNVFSKAAVLLLLALSGDVTLVKGSGCPRNQKCVSGMTITCMDTLYAQEIFCYHQNYQESDIKVNIKLMEYSGYIENDSEDNSLLNSNEIYSLDASEMNSVKTIPSVVFSWANLEQLNFSRNSFRTWNINDFVRVVKLETLDLSHNSINLIDNDDTPSNPFPALRYLYLQNNAIEYIPDNLFVKSNITTLDLSHNSIISLGSNTFVALERLNLSYNQIVKIPKQQLRLNDKLVDLDLSHNLISSMDVGAFKNKSRLSMLDLGSNRLEGTLLRGQLECLTHLIKLNLSNNRLSQIDNFAFMGVSILTSLDISYNTLKSVAKYGLISLTKVNMLDLSNNVLEDINFETNDLKGLTWFSLKSNRISNLPANFTNQLVSLQYLDISDNDVAHLHSDTFKSLINLKDLFIGSNILCGDIEDFTFRNLSSVLQLDLSHTNITGIGNDSFSGMKKLVDLNMSIGNLSHIEYNAFNETGLLRVLDLSHNRLMYFTLNNSHLQNLEELILSHNSITQIAFDTFAKLSSLKNIHLDHNSLILFHNDSLLTLKELQSVDLSYNENLQIHLSCFRNAHNLTQLTLSTIKESLVFTQMSGLNFKQLTLSKAHITNVEYLGLQNVQSLETLDLKSNNIHTINYNSFANLSTLMILDLSLNGIEIIEPGSFKDNSGLLDLKLSYNKISTVGYGNLLGLHNLRILDLSYNQILQINVHRLYNTPRLNTLIIDGNLIKYIKFEEFMKTRISTLSIGNNPLNCQQLIDYKINYNQRNMSEEPSVASDLKPTLALTSLTHIQDRENVDGIMCTGVAVVPVHLSSSNASMSEQLTTYLQDIKVILNYIKDSTNQTRPVVSSEDLKYINQNIESIPSKLQSSFNNMTRSNRTILENILNESKQDSILLGKIYGELNKLVKYLYESKNDTKAFDYRKVDTNVEGVTAGEMEVQLTTPGIVTGNIYGELNKLVKYLNEFKYDTRAFDTNVSGPVAGENKVHLSNPEIETENTTRKNTNNEMKTAKLTAVKDAPPSHSSSVFKEVCVGLILAILLGGLVYIIYLLKFKSDPSSYRSSSIQEIAMNM